MAVTGGSPMRNPHFTSLAVSAIVSLITYISFRRFFVSRPACPFVHMLKVPGAGTLKHFFLRAVPPLLLQKDFGAAQQKAYFAAEAEHGVAGTTLQFEMLPGLWRTGTAHPGDIEYVLNKNQKNYAKNADYDSLHMVLGTENLVTLRDESVHAVQRRLVAPSFSPSTLKFIADTILLHQTEKLVEKLSTDIRSASNRTMKQEGKSTIELSPYFDTLALNVVAAAAFKQGDDVAADVPAAKYFRQVTGDMNMNKALLTHILLPKCLQFLGRQRHVDELVGKLRTMGSEISSNLVAERKRKEGGGSSCGDDETLAGSMSEKKVLIDHLVEQTDLSQKALLDHIITFMFAGHETTSRALEWTSYCLATNPEVQELLLEELSTCFALDVVPHLDSLKDLPYLSAVIQESLRLYPPVPMVTRICLEDDVLPFSKAFIPKGRHLTCHITPSQRLPSLHRDPLKFDPTRWDDPSGAPRFSQATFSHGKRNCIGKEFAMNELIVVVAALVRRFRLSMPEGYVGPPNREMKVTIRPREPLHFTVEARDQ